MVLVIFPAQVKKHKAEIKIRALLASCGQTTALVCATVRVSWSWLLVVGLLVYLLLSALPIQLRHATMESEEVASGTVLATG